MKHSILYPTHFISGTSPFFGVSLLKNEKYRIIIWPADFYLHMTSRCEPTAFARVIAWILYHFL